MVFLFPPLKPPSPQISVTKVLIVCYCHDKRLRNFLARLFFTISIVVLIFVFFIQNGRLFFLFLRNVLLPIETLKIKILEHSDPPFFVHKAFSHSFFCRGKVVLCHLAEWHILPGQVYINHGLSSSSYPVFCNQSYKSHKKMKSIYSTSTHYVFINGIVLHLTAFQHFHKICTMRSVLDKKNFSDYLRHLAIKLLFALCD